MARTPTPKLPQPEVAPVAPQVTPVEAPVASPVVAEPTPSDPRIEFIGEGADQIVFTPNPKAVRIRVYASGQIVETF